MDTTHHAPGTQSEYAGALCRLQHKDSGFLLGYQQRRVYNLLIKGGIYSVADISIALRLSDPRSIIRDLRKKGIPVADVWCNGGHGGRFKRYFIRKGGVE